MLKLDTPFKCKMLVENKGKMLATHTYLIRKHTKEPSPMALFAWLPYENYPRGCKNMPRGSYKNRPTSLSRPESDPARRAVFDNNKKIILATQSICGICGMPVDKSLKYPDPFSPTVDHIIPCARGGSDDLDNLQLAHRKCNREKSDSMPEKTMTKKDPNHDLPQSVNWRTY